MVKARLLQEDSARPLGDACVWLVSAESAAFGWPSAAGLGQALADITVHGSNHLFHAGIEEMTRTFDHFMGDRDALLLLQLIRQVHDIRRWDDAVGGAVDDQT